ncbi:hypothetical protein [Capsulimonas corticalis]|uniref:hypothetical protein n=1 Tax=Capsulimonas corticalis TaxID=2219043 RepID=UPI00260A4FB6|nr:hypothetical protein [Capsulimonas corticalis]
MPGDPKQRFPHPANLEILAVLEALSSPPPTDPENIFLEIDDYELHTHPELYDCLLELSRKLPCQCFSAAFGYAILVSPGGVIFGVAGGIGYIALRLAPYMQPPDSVLDTQLNEYDSLEWGRFDMFADLDDWSKYAYEHAKQLETL